MLSAPGGDAQRAESRGVRRLTGGPRKLPRILGGTHSPICRQSCCPKEGVPPPDSPELQSRGCCGHAGGNWRSPAPLTPGDDGKSHGPA